MSVAQQNCNLLTTNTCILSQKLAKFIEPFQGIIIFKGTNKGHPISERSYHRSLSRWKLNDSKPTIATTQTTFSIFFNTIGTHFCFPFSRINPALYQCPVTSTCLVVLSCFLFLFLARQIDFLCLFNFKNVYSSYSAPIITSNVILNYSTFPIVGLTFNQLLFNYFCAPRCCFLNFN